MTNNTTPLHVRSDKLRRLEGRHEGLLSVRKGDRNRRDEAIGSYQKRGYLNKCRRG